MLNILKKLQRTEKTGADTAGTRGEKWLVVGLGNPGDKHALNWHNAGFMCMDILSEIHQIKINKIKFKGLYGQGSMGGADVVFLKPTTYMNRSGESIKEAATFFKIPHDRIIIIYDDIDIACGTMRLRMQGGAGSHNGMKSVILHMGSKDFIRVRIGIGPVPEKWDLAAYVLSDVNQIQRTRLYESLREACKAIEDIPAKGIQNAMNQHNQAKKTDRPKRSEGAGRPEGAGRHERAEAGNAEGKNSNMPTVATGKPEDTSDRIEEVRQNMDAGRSESSEAGNVGQLKETDVID